MLMKYVALFVLCFLKLTSCQDGARNITIQPVANAETLFGRNVELHCNVVTSAPYIVKWINTGYELVGQRYSINNNGTLFIKDVGFLDAGSYTCIASNQYGEATMDTNLYVIGKTTITEGPEDFEGIVGTPARFHCEIKSDPNTNLTVGWTHNNEPIDFDREYRFTLEDNHTLTISALIDLDFGTYECVATTPYETVSSSSAELVVMDIPETPEIVSLTCEKTMTIHWQPIEMNRWKILFHNVQYSSNVAPNVWIVACENVSIEHNYCSAVLTPGANYKFRIIAVNSVGPSRPSQESQLCSI